MDNSFKEKVKDFESLKLEDPDKIKNLAIKIISSHFEALDNQISNKDKTFLSYKPKGSVRRSPKVGFC